MCRSWRLGTVRWGNLGGARRSLRRDPPATLLDAQDDERAELSAEVDTGQSQQALHAIWQAETKAEAEKAFDLFLETYEPKYPTGDAVPGERPRGVAGLLRFSSPTLAEHSRPAIRLSRRSGLSVIGPSDRKAA